MTVDDGRGGAFGGRVGFGTRPVVLAVDVVRAYLDPASPLYAGVEDAAASVSRVVDTARDTGAPVVWTTVAYGPEGIDGGRFRQKVPALAVFDQGSPLGGFAAKLRPGPGELVVVKQYASAFFGTALASTLTSWGVDTVVVVGFSTSGCVRATAVDALQHGFAPVVVRDAVGDRTPGPHEANLHDLDTKYADVVSEAEAVAALRAVA